LGLAAIKHIDLAAQLMRLILIDHARQSHSAKRLHATGRVPLHEEMAWIDAAGEDMLALDAALDQLEALDARKVHATELRFIPGCSNEEGASFSPYPVRRSIAASSFPRPGISGSKPSFQGGAPTPGRM
jgi:hypothetical protein